MAPCKRGIVFFERVLLVAIVAPLLSVYIIQLPINTNTLENIVNLLSFLVLFFENCYIH